MRIFKQSNSDTYKLSYSDTYNQSYSDSYKLSYSDLFRVSIDPRVKPEDSNYYIVMPRFGTNRQGIFELTNNLNNLRISNRLLLQTRDDNLKKSSLRAGTRGQAIFELVFFTLVSSTSIAQAECVPLPDCASIGYTETSCEGGFVRCPFDITKLYCMPCDSSYQYSCSDSGQVGNGESCNGKYVSCECAEGYELVDGNCIVSCAYTLTTLPTGCSAVDDSCIKNGTTYYSPTCTSCKTGYTISSGSCSANTCSGYYASKTGCSNYSTCQSGATTKYKCTSCNSGYTLSSGQCTANACDGYYSGVVDNCSSYTTCLSGTTTTYKCTACSSGYTLCESNARCIDTYCYADLTGRGYSCDKIRAQYCGGFYNCYGNDGNPYSIGNVCISPGEEA